LRKYIRPLAEKVGIEKRFGWHTFRHTYSTLLRSVGTEFTQAVTPAKHAAQAAVVSLVFSSSAGEDHALLNKEATAS